MNLHFTKMQGLGNDFVVINAIDQKVDLNEKLIQLIADRHYGIGCDQVLVLDLPRSSQEDFFYRVFNSNGTEVEQCGNGVRCLTRFIHDHQLSSKKIVKIATKNTLMQATLCENGFVKVNMGEPILAWRNIPFAHELAEQKWMIDLEGSAFEFVVLSMGNPHAVTCVAKIEEAPVEAVGSKISVHADFPLQTNVGFMEVLNEHQIALRVYERHEGETLACGSGACAAVAAGILQNKLGSQVEVRMRGGILQIEWQGEGHPLWMSGPAKTVFQGVYSLS